jgi:hypothetical protein
MLLIRLAALAWQLHYCGVRRDPIGITQILKIDRCRDTSRSWKAYPDFWTQCYGGSLYRAILLWTDLHRRHCLCQVLHSGLVLADI